MFQVKGLTFGSTVTPFNGDAFGWNGTKSNPWIYFQERLHSHDLSGPRWARLPRARTSLIKSGRSNCQTGHLRRNTFFLFFLKTCSRTHTFNITRTTLASAVRPLLPWTISTRAWPLLVHRGGARRLRGICGPQRGPSPCPSSSPSKRVYPTLRVTPGSVRGRRSSVERRELV